MLTPVMGIEGRDTEATKIVLDTIKSTREKK